MIVSRHKISRHRAFLVKFPSWNEERERRRNRNFRRNVSIFRNRFSNLFDISLLATLETRYFFFSFFFFPFRKTNSNATRNEKPSTNARTRETREILVFDNSSASSAVDRDSASDLYRDGMNHPRRQKEPDKYITVCRCREITKIRA